MVVWVHLVWLHRCWRTPVDRHLTPDVNRWPIGVADRCLPWWHGRAEVDEVSSCELLVSHDSYYLAWCNWFNWRCRSMLDMMCRSVLVWLHRSMFLPWCRLTPVRTTETHRGLNFKVAPLKLLLLNHLPEIIIYDDIQMVFQCSTTCQKSSSMITIYRLLE